MYHKNKKSYFDAQFLSNKSNIKKTWSLINSIINKSNKPALPDHFLDSLGNKITDSLDISNHFNSYFSEIGTKLSNQIPPSSKSFTDYLLPPPACNFEFSTVDENDVLKVINSLKSKSSSGIDSMSTKLSKSIKVKVSPILTLIFNQSIMAQTFPNRLTIAKVVPVYKKGDPMCFENYRPISLLPTISKVFERLLHNQMTYYLETNQLIIPNQFGYRRGHSTELASATLVERIHNLMDKKLDTIGIFMDLSKAFDTIDHKILLKKLKQLNFAETSLNLIKSYLNDRTQCVEILGELSNFKTITLGVPQGSILGPLLFILYINDINNVSDLFDSVLYADDTTLTYSPTRTLDAIHTSNVINSELDKFNQWFRANKLSLNVTKTNFMIFHPPRITPLDLKLQINGINIERLK